MKFRRGNREGKKRMKKLRAAGSKVRTKGSNLATTVAKPVQDHGKAVGAATLAGAMIAGLAGLGFVSPAQAGGPSGQFEFGGGSYSSSGSSFTHEGNPVEAIKSLMHEQAGWDKGPNMLNQDPGSTEGDGFNVTVGKGVVIAADPSGKPTLTAMVANTQASGTGSREVQVPMATTKAGSSTSFSKPTMQGENAVYEISNDNGGVQHFGASNSEYKNKLPISVKVQTWVDGKEIPPAEMVNVSGHVKVSYTIKNETAVETDLHFRDTQKKRQMIREEVPIPFGASLNTTLPFGFADVNAPWAQGGMGPSGMVLAGTAMLLGPIPIIGGLEKTLTWEARATNASLPAVNISAAPIVLSENKMANMALEGGPVAEELAQYGANGIGFAEGKLLKYHQLFTQYAAKADAMNREYIEPIIRGFQDGQYDKTFENGLAQVRALDDGARQLNSLLPSATMVIQTLSNSVDEVVPIAKNHITTLNKVIDTYEKYMPVIIEMMPELEAVEQMIEKTAPEDFQKLQSGLTMINGACTKGQTMLPKAENMAHSMQPHKSAIDTALGIISPDAQAAFDAFMGITDDQWAAYIKDVDDCVTSYVPMLQKFLTEAEKLLPEILIGMQMIIEIMEQKIIPMMKKYNPTIEDFRKNEKKYIRMIDNNNCDKTPDDIARCGYKQQLDFLTDMMILARDSVRDKMVPSLDFVVDQYLPMAERYFTIVSSNVRKYGPEFEAMLPNVINRIENAFDTGDSILTKADGIVNNFGNKIGVAVAAMDEMQRRAAAGEGIPGGPAKGADTNLGAYQFALAAASDQQTQNTEALGLAGLMGVAGLGAGTYLYRRNEGGGGQ